MDDKRNPQPSYMDSTPLWRSRYGVGFLVFGVVAAYFLLAEHRAHFFGALPFLLILACPLIHVFMHGRHADRHDGQQGSNPAVAPQPGGTGGQP